MEQQGFGGNKGVRVTGTMVKVKRNEDREETRTSASTKTHQNLATIWLQLTVSGYLYNLHTETWVLRGVSEFSAYIIGQPPLCNVPDKSPESHQRQPQRV